jgi:integrase
MESAVEAARTALRRIGASEEYVERVLADLGLDAPREANRRQRPAGRSVQNEDEVTAARPGVYRVVGVKRLYLKKATKEKGSYFVRWRIPTTLKRSEIGLGSIADVMLADAKARAAAIDVGLHNGVNPHATRGMLAAEIERKAVEEKRQAALPTMREEIAAYVATKTWKHIYGHANWLNPIERYALPVIGDLKPNQVEPKHILKIIADAEAKGAPSLASKVRSNLGTVFGWLKAHQRRVGDNPADARTINPGHNGRGNGKKAKTEHYRRIEIDDAPATFQKLYGLTLGNAAHSCWVFMVLTAARPGDALSARWDQVNWGKKIWKNPVSKTEEPLEVPLSSAALAILLQAKERSTSDLIFAGNGGGKLAHSNFGSAPKRAGIEAGTAHSWRSIFRDTVEDRLHYTREIAEVALGHSLGAVERAYRRETGVEKRAEMMEAYLGWLTRTSAGNVVALKRA